MSLVVRAFPLRGTRPQLEAFAAALHGECQATPGFDPRATFGIDPLV